MRAVRVGGFVAFVNRRAQILQAFGGRRRLGVRAGNGIAEREQHFGDAAHSDAADADEMDALKIPERDHHDGNSPWRFACTPAAFSTPSKRSTMSLDAFGLASLRAFVASRSSC